MTGPGIPAYVRWRIEETLNCLPAVKWDRFIDDPAGGIDVYGWIARDDGLWDFVVVNFDRAGEWTKVTTSSASHSASIYAALLGMAESVAAEHHSPCMRVDEHFPGVKRTTRNPRRTAA